MHRLLPIGLLSMEKTNQIEIGSAVLSILANGGDLSPKGSGTSALQEVRGDSRKLNVGFGAGRFNSHGCLTESFRGMD